MKVMKKNSKMTRASFLSQISKFRKRMESWGIDETLGENRDSLVADIDSLKDEVDGEGRYNSLEEWSSALEYMDCDNDVEKHETDDDIDEPHKSDFYEFDDDPDTFDQEGWEEAVSDYTDKCISNYEDKRQERFDEIHSELMKCRYEGK